MVDIEPKHAPRTPISFLERHAVFLEYVDPAGLVRLRGHVSLSPASPRFGTPTLRFNHAQNVQLLRPTPTRRHRARAGQPGEGRGQQRRPRHGDVLVGIKEFAVRDLPGAFEGELYDFTIWPGCNEPSVSGKASVTASPPRATSSSTSSWSPSSSGAPRSAADRERNMSEQSKPKVAEHPVAARQIARARAWGALVGFVLVYWLSRRAGLPFPESGGRALTAGSLAGCSPVRGRHRVVSAIPAQIAAARLRNVS